MTVDEHVKNLLGEFALKVAALAAELDALRSEREDLIRRLRECREGKKE